MGIVIPTDFHMFQRGRYTTSHFWIVAWCSLVFHCHMKFNWAEVSMRWQNVTDVFLPFYTHFPWRSLPFCRHLIPLLVARGMDKRHRAGTSVWKLGMEGAAISRPELGLHSYCGERLSPSGVLESVLLPQLQSQVGLMEMSGPNMWRSFIIGRWSPCDFFCRTLGHRRSAAWMTEGLPHRR